MIANILIVEDDTMLNKMLVDTIMKCYGKN